MKLHAVKELDNRFYISESKQIGAGKGLFAKTNLKKGDYLKIVGVIAQSRDCVEYADSHSFLTKDGECWIPLGFGGMVNHASNPSHQNVKYGYDGEQPVYYLLRDIEKDEEILCDYGSGFANILATYLSLGASGDLFQWARDCENLGNNKEVKEFCERNLLE